MDEQKFQRQTAKICSVLDLLTGTYVIQDGWKPNYVQTITPARKLSRVNLMGFIVEKSTPHQFLLDDGTGTILVIDFSQNENTATLKVGKPVLVIGRPRQAEKNVFIALEIATTKQLEEEPLWMSYRKQELKEVLADKEDEELVTAAPAKEKELLVAKKPTLPVKELTGDMIFDFIKNNEQDEGCDMELIINKFGQEVDDMIFTLISMGELYEAKPGKLKILE